MNWYYAENNQRNGPVSEGEFEQLARDGKITPETLVWCEGMAAWQSYREVVPSSSVVESPLAGDEAVQPAVSPERDGPPWENRASLGLVNAISETIKSGLFESSMAFTQMKRTGGFSDPLRYALLVGGIASYIAAIYNIIYQHITGYPTLGRDWTVQYVHHPVYYAVLLSIFALFLVPLGIAAGAFIYAAVLHLCLMLFGGAKQPFEATFRVVCYSFGSNAIWRLIPLFGFYLFVIWGIVVTSIGIARTHEIPTGKAVVAVLMPAIVCFCAMVAVFALFFWLVMAAGVHP